MHTLILRLEGPMQAWGMPGAGEVRRTHHEPTKRAVLGLIRAARGLARSETWPALEDLEFTVLALRRPRRAWDFGTMANAISADGTKLHEQGIQHREYLADAGFLIALRGTDGLISEIQGALGAPRFLTGLGRRDYVPSHPLLESVSAEEAGVALDASRKRCQALHEEIFALNFDKVGDGDCHALSIPS